MGTSCSANLTHEQRESRRAADFHGGGGILLGEGAEGKGGAIGEAIARLGKELGGHELRCPRSQGDGVAACRRVGERGLCGQRSGWLGFNETSLALHWLAWTATGIGQQRCPG